MKLTITKAEYKLLMRALYDAAQWQLVVRESYSTPNGNFIPGSLKNWEEAKSKQRAFSNLKMKLKKQQAQT